MPANFLWILVIVWDESRQCWCSCGVVVTWWLCQHGRLCECTEGEGPGCSTDLVMSPSIIQHWERWEGERLWEAPSHQTWSAMCGYRRSVTGVLQRVNAWHRLSLNLGSGGADDCYWQGRLFVAVGYGLWYSKTCVIRNWMNKNRPKM